MDAVESAQRPNESAGGDAARRGSSPRAAVILGNDAVVAARPASPATLSRACTAAGFDIVVPPSWGDELVAQGYLAELAECRDPLAVACTCPRVAALLAVVGTHKPVRKVAVAPPPIATARYLRLVYGKTLLVTFVGDCPSASDASINARFTPAGFFASLHRQGITLDTSATAEMDDATSERWRRHRSVPGGLPALRFLARAPVDRLLRDVDAAGIDPALWQSHRSHVLLDLASSAGCSCSGNRSVIEESEPSRSARPVLVPPPGLNLRADIGAAPLRSTARERRPISPAVAPTARPQASPPLITPPSEAKRIETPSPPAVPPPTPISAPETDATAGEPVRVEVSVAPAPRPATHVALGTPVSRAARVAGAPDTRAEAKSTARPQPKVDETLPAPLRLVAIPAIVLAMAAALGIAAYIASASVTPAATTAPAGHGRATLTGEAAPPSESADSALSARSPDSSARSANALGGSRGSVPPPVTTTPAPNGARSSAAPATVPATPAASAAAPSGAPIQARRARMRPTPQVVPGWLPQGQKAWTPDDSVARGRRNSTPVTPKPDTVPRA